MVAIAKRTSVACRCRYCGRRKRLSMHPSHFVRVPRCGCSRERREFDRAKRECAERPMTWRIDVYRNSGREHAARPCQCAGYSYPHRRASGWCDDNPKWTAEDAEKRQSWA